MGSFSVILTFTIFFGSLVLIFWEKINRSIVAIAGSVLMIGAGKILDFYFYNEDLAIEAIGFNMLGLLLGMKILVFLLEPTGFFDYLAVLAARAAGARSNQAFRVNPATKDTDSS